MDAAQRGRRDGAGPGEVRGVERNLTGYEYKLI
jgi:hypothetical protein